MLTSVHNPRVKLVRQLQQRREAREQERAFVAEGARLVADFLAAGLICRFLCASGEAEAAALRRAAPGVDCLLVGDAVMRALSVEITPSGVLGVFAMPDWPAGASPAAAPLLLILDGIREPGNLGACLRVAAGAGCQEVLLSPGSVDVYNPKVVRGGMGAHARIRVRQAGYDDIRAACAGRLVWAARADGAIPYHQADWRRPSAVIIGGEAQGVSPELNRLATGAISIPLANRVESLNAAVACGVILFEAARQRV